ncbi:hypothetical protein GALL_531770 [mine drainage metagenome]|uniref:Uncharacterized protein n=1 Tax=mine drainage metagenome TaxID=410659 RepID=A0A1J5P2H3_9ZZZZ
MQTRIVCCTGCRVFGIGAGRVVTAATYLPARCVPHLVQVSQFGAENGSGIAPDLDFTDTGLNFGCHRAGFAHHMAVLAQSVLAQDVHDRCSLRRGHLQHHPWLFTKQRLERQLVTPAADLAGPVLTVTDIHATVRNAVTFSDQHVHIQCHPDMAGKSHLAHGGKQSAVAAIVVRQDEAASAQGVDGLDQIDQVLRVVQIGHLVTQLAQGLRQNAGTHAVLATPQVNQDQ